MKNQGKMFLYIIGVVASFFISLPVKADPLFDACKKTWGADYTPVVGIPGVEYNLNDENDPRDNTCGVEGSNVLCPGAYENLGNGNNSDTSSGCCKRVVNSVTEYRCVAFGSVVSPVTTVPDATKVDIKAEEEEAGLLADQCKEKEDVKFVPQVTIPGSITLGGKEITVREGEGVTVTPSTAAEYFAVFYRFFVAALAVIAVVMIMWGGFKRIMAAGSPERVKSANETIIGAITGVVIALISYTLLSLINPALVSLKPLEAITPIACIELNLYEDESGEDITPLAGSTGLTSISGENIVNPGGEQTNVNAALALRLVAIELKQQGVKLKVASGYRAPTEQQSLINKNCPAGATSSSQCSPPTCLMKNGPNACPHTSGSAVDVWPVVGNTVPVEWTWCKKNRSACGENSSMKLLAQTMRNQGFCKLCSEPWHFEMPKVSSCCN